MADEQRKQLLEGNRRIVERIVVTGELVLETPAHFGGDDALGFVDMALVRDPLHGDALLPGASIAGALRSYLRTRLAGYGVKEPHPKHGDDDLALLFGYQHDDDGAQSSLLTADARSRFPAVELRDGVAINPVTRTADDKKKFNLELLPAGVIFDLRLELLVRAADADKGAQDDQATRMVTAFAHALQGFERGEIPLGARKRRGFGKCRVHAWQVRRYDLRQPPALLAWLSQDAHGAPTAQGAGPSIAQLLGVADRAEPDKRAGFTLRATFGLESSLLIRAGGDEAGQPDMVHLTSPRNGKPAPILSGTSWAGVLRSRALRIAQTVGARRRAVEYIADLFGPQMTNANVKPRASRLWVEESIIEQPAEPLIVQRVQIDRFTGGTLPGALFAEQPVFAAPQTEVRLEITVQAQRGSDAESQRRLEADAGLLLLLLKDLWVGDLPLGGEASVGRGRLQGKCATLTFHKPESDDGPAWTLTRADDRVAVAGDAAELERMVKLFLEEVRA